MLREKVVFGPVRSRRLGVSLGINLLPENGKLCNFDCVYCECGLNRDGRGDVRIPSADEVGDALRSKLEEMNARGEKADSISFTGDGEPTLNPAFPEIIDRVTELRNTLMPSAIISVFSNSTRAHDPKILAALKKVDNPIMKIDASSNALVGKINQPVGDYDLRRVVDSLKGFDGNFILQTMFVRFPGFDSLSEDNLRGWMEIVRELSPRQVMVYTIERPTPTSDIERITEEEMTEAVKPLVDLGFDVQVRG